MLSTRILPARLNTGTKETWQEANEAASRITQRSMERFSKMFGLGGETAREALQQSSGNLQAIMPNLNSKMAVVSAST